MNFGIQENVFKKSLSFHLFDLFLNKAFLKYQQGDTVE
jgi:hypothetical protein